MKSEARIHQQQSLKMILLIEIVEVIVNSLRLPHRKRLGLSKILYSKMLKVLKLAKTQVFKLAKTKRMRLNNVKLTR